MPICTCPCPLHAGDGEFDVEAFWESLIGRSPTTRTDTAPARLVFMGDGRVGTSSLIRRFTTGQYASDYKPEIAKVMRHTKSVRSNRLAAEAIVQFWDIEGSDARTALLCAQKAHAVAVVYDITNRSSFELAQRLLDGINPRASVILIANKCDQESQRKVSHQEGKLLSRIHKVEFLEVSAKLNYKVDAAFQVVIDSVPEEYLGSRDSSALKATRRWQASASAVVCSVCHQKLAPPRSRTKGHASEGDQNAPKTSRARPRSDSSGRPFEKTISI